MNNEENKNEINNSQKVENNTDLSNKQGTSNVVNQPNNNYQQQYQNYNQQYNQNQYNNQSYYNNGNQQYYNNYGNQQYYNGYNNQYYNQQNYQQQNMNYQNGYYNNYYQQQYYNPQNNYYSKKKSHGFRNGLLIFSIIIAVIAFWGFIIGISLNRKANRNVECKRALMIYMVGSDLETDNGIATSDLNGLDYNKLEANGTKVILIAGGTKKWHNSYINGDETSIYELTDDGFVVVKKQKEQNMASYKTLKDFLNYTYNNYHADKYDLVFWNHGAGIFGNEFDELHDGDYLTINEIRNALEQSEFSSGNKLEAIIFRTCLNGTIEMADAIKDYAEYMVASQEVAWGYNKASVLKYFNDVKSDDNGYELGVKFVNGYKEYLSYLNDKYIYRTYSVIDLSKIDNLEKSIGDFFESINLKNNYNQIAKIRAQLFQYGGDEKTYDSIDLYNLIDKLKYLSPDKGQVVLDNITKTVLYNSATDAKSRGLSIYFPYSGKKDEKDTILTMFYNYNNLSKYKEFIGEFFSMQSTAVNKQSYSKNIISYSERELDNSADFILELSDEQLDEYAMAEYVVFLDYKDGTYVPIYRGRNVIQDGNLLKANIKGRQIQAHDAYDDSSSPITLIEEEETDEYIKYKTYIMLTNDDIENYKNDVAETTIIYDKYTNEITLGPAFVQSNADDEKSLYNVLVDYEDYVYIYFSKTGYNILDEDGNYITDWDRSDTLKYFYATFDNLSFDLVDFNDSDDDYYAIFYIYDINNNYSFSNLIKIK